MTRRTLALATIAAALSTAGAFAATQQAPRAAPPKPSEPCSMPQPTPETSAATPSRQLLDALAVLRRPRVADDAVPTAALRFPGPLEGAMLDAARRVDTDLWLVPVADLAPTLRIPERCLRKMPADQRRETRRQIERSRTAPPVEGVVMATRTDMMSRYRTPDVLAGRAFTVQGCTGSMHDRITVEGIVPDSVTQVTLAARDGGLLVAAPVNNAVRFDLARPDTPSGLPAHITSGTLEYGLDPHMMRGLDQPCEPPTRNSIGRRREPPTPLDSPAGARIVLETTRWQPEDTGPQVAGATYRRGGRRCLLIAPERDLRAGARAHRFCVDEDKLRAERFVARATRLANGDVVLEGFVDRSKISAIVIERSIRPGAHRLEVARGSGAFFMAIRGEHPRGGTFKIHAALRGAPIRYTGLTNITLKPK